MPPVVSRPAVLLSILTAIWLPVSGTVSGRPAAGAVLHEVRLEQTEPFRWELRLVSSTELDLVGIQRADEGLSIQLPRHEPAPELRDLAFADGPVESIRFRVEATSRGPNVRIAVDFRKPLSYAMRTEGAIARVGLWPRELASPEEELRRRVEELRTQLTRAASSREELAGRLALLSAEQRRIREALEASEVRRAALRPRLDAALERAGTSVRDLAAELETTRLRLAGAEEREARLRAEVASLEEAFLGARDEASEVLAEQRARIARLEAENARLLEELALRDRELLELRTGIPDPGRSPPDAVARDAPAESVELLGPRRAATGRVHLIVAATELERERAERKAAAVRELGYSGEIHRSSGGFLLVLLDRLPYRDAILLREEAIADGAAPPDTYLIPVD